MSTLYRIECWSHATGWFPLPGYRALSREVAEDHLAELAKPGRKPLRLPAELRVMPDN